MSDTIFFFSDEYNEEQWRAYANSFAPADVHITGVSQDIVNAVVGLLGNEAGEKWLTETQLTQFDSKKATDILRTPMGARALKAFIMRFPC